MNDESELRVKTAAELCEEARRAQAIASELATQARAAALREEAESRPREPVIGSGGDRVIVSFTKYQSGREYHYAAIGWRVGNSVRWAVTGQTTDRLNWPGLLEFIGGANWHSLVRMGQTELLGPMPGAEPPAREVMGSFGRVQRTDVARRLDADDYGDTRW